MKSKEKENTELNMAMLTKGSRERRGETELEDIALASLCLTQVMSTLLNHKPRQLQINLVLHIL
jgi:hypothetical protein